MPSPVGHALAGLVTGALTASPRRPDPRVSTLWGRGLLCAAVACLPDLDLTLGVHSMYTHSLGAVVIVGAVAALAFRRDWPLAAACTLAYATHPVLDWLGRDTSPPLGIMALWPFSDAFFIAPHPFIPPVNRRYWLPDFWEHNLRVVSVELVVFGSLALLALEWRRRRPC